MKAIEQIQRMMWFHKTTTGMGRNLVCCIFVWGIIFRNFFFLSICARFFSTLSMNELGSLMHHGMDDSYIMLCKKLGVFYISILIL